MGTAIAIVSGGLNPSAAEFAWAFNFPVGSDGYE